MFRVDASAITAQVVNVKAWRYRADNQHISESVREHPPARTVFVSTNTTTENTVTRLGI
jgi:hypothetical protein